MICPECHTEYRDGYSHCSDCDVPLVHELGATGATDSMMPLARSHSFELVAELLDRLEKNDLPYVIEAGTALRLLDREVADMTSPEPWEARVWVSPSALETATGILEELEAEWRAQRGEQTARRHLGSRDPESRDFD